MRTGTSISGWNAGSAGRAQIGKGMWAMPDMMAEMLEAEDRPPEGRRQHRLGAVADRGDAARHPLSPGRRRRPSGRRSGAAATRRAWRYPDRPARRPAELGPEDIQAELDNNAQGILGYVVRWVDQGVGCSKVPDINDVGLMEDRATLRISSQHIANWLRHGVCGADTGDGDHEARSGSTSPMAPDDFEHSIAFKAACDLVFEGKTQPNGYTEPILHKRRLEVKAAAG